jgi:hypothetical protein
MNERFVQILNQIIVFKLVAECERGWSRYHNKCIKLFTEYKTWSEAKNFCESNNATMISINSEEENDFVLNLAKKQSKNWVLTGGKRNTDNNRFEWINGKEFNYTNWKSGRRIGFDYVLMRGDGMWYDYSGQTAQPFLCEYIPSSF